jgi:hypothetical protein
MSTRHFVDTEDFSRARLLQIIQLASRGMLFPVAGDGT